MDNSSVVVTGLACMTGLGLNLETTWDGLINGRVPIKRFSHFDPNTLPSTFGVELPEKVEELFKKHIKPRRRKQMTRSTKMALITLLDAVYDSGYCIEDNDPSKVGIVIGSTGTGYAPTSQKIDRNRILLNMANAPASWASIRLKTTGPAFTVSTACSSGTYALHSAIMLLKSGQCDVVITGATDSVINYPDIEGFCSLLALSEDNKNMATASRPFDKNRDGFVMGEGCAMMVIERFESAKKRGAKISACVHTPALSSEAYNIMSPRQDGSGMAMTISLALKNAGLMPKQIDYINAHGTSTNLNDICETIAIKKAFGAHAKKIAISSTKSMTGHCLSAAAGVEGVICCKAIMEGVIPQTQNLNTPDPECNLDYVTEGPRKMSLSHVMSNSFAFGGHNGVTIFSKP